jgi:hypothetical protein
MNTRISKGREGFEALTTVAMPEIGPDYQLRIQTSKRYSGGVTTMASMVKVSKDTGTGFSGFSFQMFGDFSQPVKVNGVALKAARCTENNVREQHSIALRQLETIQQEARHFYSLKGIKAAQEEFEEERSAITPDVAKELAASFIKNVPSMAEFDGVACH